MDLYFSRRRFFQTGFYAPHQKTSKEQTNNAAQFEEIYRVSTTVRKGSILPDTTTIEYVGSEDYEKHYVVATIEWHWPSQTSSIIEIDGNRLPLKFFMKREGLLRCAAFCILLRLLALTRSPAPERTSWPVRSASPGGPPSVVQPR